MIAWRMFSNAFRLFIKGRLFRDPLAVARQWSIGFALAAAMVVIARLAGLPLWLAVVLAALVTGGLQPYLFRDLKYN